MSIWMRKVEQGKDGHRWRVDEDGVIDTFAMSIDFHNGPVCEVCGYSYCVHCDGESHQKCKDPTNEQ